MNSFYYYCFFFLTNLEYVSHMLIIYIEKKKKKIKIKNMVQTHPNFVLSLAAFS